MHNHRSHPLLEQVPLTVSPFVSLPTAPTLSYTYKTMPSNIPPSALGIPTASDAGAGAGAADQQHQPRPRYVVSQSGSAAHPDEIIASCQALRAYIAKMQEDSQRELCALEERIRQRDLAEKRRLAPGWLDSEARLLQPEKGHYSGGGDRVMAEAAAAAPAGEKSVDTDMSLATTDEGAALDRAFGGMELK